MSGQELTKDIIKNSISNPQKCGLTGKIACLDVDLSENELCDVKAISSYDRLQHVNMSSNLIQDFSPLRKLLMIKSLDISKNKIKSLSPLICEEKEEETLGSRALETLNLSSNEISEIEGALGCTFLKSLHLDHNVLKEMGGKLENLTFLQTLSISNNKLLTTRGISGLNLRVLDLSRNHLDALGDVFKSLPNVRDVNLSGNNISTLDNLSYCTCLRKLNLSRNRIIGIRQIEHLSKLKRLESLDLRENEICKITDYRSRVIYRIRWMLRFDDVDISSKDKVLAFNVYGVDLKQRMATHEKHVPEYQFVHPLRKWRECRDVPKLRWCVKRDLEIINDNDDDDDVDNKTGNEIHVVLEAWDEGEGWDRKQEFEQREEEKISTRTCEGLVLRAFEVSTNRAVYPLYVENDKSEPRDVLSWKLET